MFDIQKLKNNILSEEFSFQRNYSKFRYKVTLPGGQVIELDIDESDIGSVNPEVIWGDITYTPNNQPTFCYPWQPVAGVNNGRICPRPVFDELSGYTINCIQGPHSFSHSFRIVSQPAKNISEFIENKTDKFDSFKDLLYSDEDYFKSRLLRALKLPVEFFENNE